MPRRAGESALVLIPLLLSTACGESTAPAAGLGLIVVSGSGLEGVVGAVLQEPLVVRVEDSAGSPVGGIGVRWGSEDPSAEFSADITATDDAGLAEVLWRLGTAAGTQRAEASLAGGARVAFEATARPGAAASVLLNAPVDSLEVGSGIEVALTGADVYGNELSVADVVWSSSAPEVGTVDEQGRVTAVGPGFVQIRVNGGVAPIGATVALKVHPLTRFASIHSRGGWYCGVSLDGLALCWGDPAHVRPARVAGARELSVLTASYDAACGTTESGELWCWGDNTFGDLDPGSAETWLPEPVRIDHPQSFELLELARHDFACGVADGGRLYCWGHNDYGQVGRGTRTSSEREVLPVDTEARFRAHPGALSGGTFHGCAVDLDDRVRCWGDNASGQIGSGTADDVIRPPSPSASDEVFRMVVTAHLSTCALATDGRAFCWGDNRSGQLGVGDFETKHAPTEVPGLRFSALVLGTFHACGLTTGGETYCWGDNGEGQLGSGSAGAASPIPVRVQTGIAFTALAAADQGTCGLDAEGRAHCWGRGADDGTSSPLPVPVRWAVLEPWGSTDASAVGSAASLEPARAGAARIPDAHRPF